MKIKIERLGRSRLPELLDFLKKHCPDHPELGEGSVVKWSYGHCDMFIATYDSRIVGCAFQIPHVFNYGKASKMPPEQIGWLTNFILDMSDSKIRKEAGRALLNKEENNPPLKFNGLAMIPPIEAVYRRRGHQIRRDCCNMYARFENPSKVLKYLSKPSFYAPIIRLMNLFCRVWAGLDEDMIEGLTPIDRFEADWDSIVDGILYEQYELYGIRNAEYLNYKLTQPNREYDVYRHITGGYIILRTAKHPIKDLTLVKVCDLVGSDGVKQRLLRLAMKYYYHVKADGIVAIDSAGDKKLYRSVGMYISKPYPICLHKSIKAKVHISFFDSDLDNLW